MENIHLHISKKIIPMCIVKSLGKVIKGPNPYKKAELEKVQDNNPGL